MISYDQGTTWEDEAHDMYSGAGNVGYSQSGRCLRAKAIKTREVLPPREARLNSFETWKTKGKSMSQGRPRYDLVVGWRITEMLR